MKEDQDRFGGRASKPEAIGLWGYTNDGRVGVM